MGKRNTSYGGQAVIEGVVMRGPQHMALSVRDPHGHVICICETLETLAQRSKFAKFPVVRGAVSMWESLSLGIKTLMKSAEIASPEEGQPSENELSLAVLIAFVAGLSLFVLLPAFAAPLIMKALSVSGRFWASFVESGLRLSLLLAYVVSISKMEDIQRVLEYHGAEHKVIWAYEKNADQVHRILEKPIEEKQNSKSAIEFLVKKAIPEKTLHPRCGTSFLFIAVIITWIVFLIVSPEKFIVKIIARIAALPIVAGIAYEVLKTSAGREGSLWNLIKLPGFAMQKLTTRQPDEAQLEVAAYSLVSVILAEIRSNT